MPWRRKNRNSPNRSKNSKNSKNKHHKLQNDNINENNHDGFDGHNDGNNNGGTKNKRRRSFLSKIRSGQRKKRKNSQEVQETYYVNDIHSSPTRSMSMPSEIDVVPGTPSSQCSALTGHTTTTNHVPKVKSMMTSMLPELNDEEGSEVDDAEGAIEDIVVGKNLFGFSISSPINKSSPVKNSLAAIDEMGAGAGGVKTKSKSDSSRSISLSPKKIMERKRPSILANARISRLTKTKFFQNMVKKVYDKIDADESGSIDKKELYSGLLMIHLKLASYIGASACRPATRQYVNKLFDELDVDQNGTLNQTEFASLMAILCSHILTRMAIQMSMTLTLIPILTQYLLDGIAIITHLGYMLWYKLDEAEDVSEDVWRAFMTILGWLWRTFIPNVIRKTLVYLFELVKDLIPDETMGTVHLTIISTVLSCVLIPTLINTCDGLFNDYAGVVKKKKIESSMRSIVSSPSSTTSSS